MTASESFVHARFQDGSTNIVGRYRTIRNEGQQPIGEFQYVGSWLRNDHGKAFPLDPVNLPLAKGEFLTRKRGRLPGALSDTTPDRWGRRLIEATRPAGSPLMSPADWLSATGDERVGCLTFSPTAEPLAPSSGYASILDVEELAQGFDRLVRGDPVSAEVERLFRAGRSLGGARPKAAVAHEGSLWIAKFQRHDDEYDQAAAEHAAMRLAAACGIAVAETRLIDIGPRRVVLVKRFDRTDAGPPFQPTAHFVSALSLLDLDDTSGEGSYMAIAGMLRRYGSRHGADREELFRRMVFNVLAGNRDDHLKNHALLHEPGKGWILSPAFDIVPQPDMEPMQAIAVGRIGAHPTVLNCLSLCGEFGLDQETAQGTVDRMIATMRPWRRMFEEWGVDPGTIRRLGRAFAAELGEDIAPSFTTP